MDFIRQYRLLILGGMFLVLAVLASGSGKESETPAQSQEVASAPRAPAPSVPGRTEKAGPKKRSRRHRRETPAPMDSAGEAPQAEADEDTTKEAEEKFDPAAAKDRAVAEVKSYNAELAGVLRTFNPNARKTRLKASQLRQKARALDRWIESRDSGSNMSDRQRLEWQAQRDVWIKQSKELKRIAKRLSATRGTRRKVRILAKEIADTIGD